MTLVGPVPVCLLLVEPQRGQHSPSGIDLLFHATASTISLGLAASGAGALGDLVAGGTVVMLQMVIEKLDRAAKGGLVFAVGTAKKMRQMIALVLVFDKYASHAHRQRQALDLVKG